MRIALADITERMNAAHQVGCKAETSTAESMRCACLIQIFYVSVVCKTLKKKTAEEMLPKLIGAANIITTDIIIPAEALIHESSEKVAKNAQSGPTIQSIRQSIHPPKEKVTESTANRPGVRNLSPASTLEPPTPLTSVHRERRISRESRASREQAGNDLQQPQGLHELVKAVTGLTLKVEQLEASTQMQVAQLSVKVDSLASQLAASEQIARGVEAFTQMQVAQLSVKVDSLVSHVAAREQIARDVADIAAEIARDASPRTD